MTDPHNSQPLASAAAFLPATQESHVSVHTGRAHIDLDAPRPGHPHADAPTPLGLLAAAVASDLAITVRSYTNSVYGYPGDIDVHVKAVRSADGLRLQCTLTHTEELEDDQVADVLELTKRTPLQELLQVPIDLQVRWEPRGKPR
jgi:uncharacterized OsmC-like protein